MRRMTVAETPKKRAAIRAEQGNVCAICDKPFYEKAPLDPVLDHDHKTGALRGTIHRGCNSLLGKIENYIPRAWIKPAELPTVLAGMADYLLSPDPRPGVVHHSHRDSGEKAALAKFRAKKRRAIKKAIA